MPDTSTPRPAPTDVGTYVPPPRVSDLPWQARVWLAAIGAAATIGAAFAGRTTAPQAQTAVAVDSLGRTVAALSGTVRTQGQELAALRADVRVLVCVSYPQSFECARDRGSSQTASAGGEPDARAVTRGTP